MVDRKRFDKAYAEVINNTHFRYNIGTYKERTRHLILKYYYEPDPSFHEVSVLSHIADISNESGIIEIQTSGFGSLKRKLDVFLNDGKNVKIVYPVSYRKRILRTFAETGESTVGNYRTYPKSIYKILPELLRISEYFDYDNISVDIVLTTVTEFRESSVLSKKNRRKETVTDTVPDDITDIITLHFLSDIKNVLPFKNGSLLFQKDISRTLGLTRRNLWMALQIMIKAGIIVEVEPNGNKKTYKVITDNNSEVV